MKKIIIVAGMAVSLTIAGIANTQETEKKCYKTTMQTEVNHSIPSHKSIEMHGQKMLSHQHDYVNAEIMRQHDKMIAQFISVHKEMVKDFPENMNLNGTENLSPEMRFQHNAMLLQIALMHELMDAYGILEKHDDEILPLRIDLEKMEKISRLIPDNNGNLNKPLIIL